MENLTPQQVPKKFRVTKDSIRQGMIFRPSFKVAREGELYRMIFNENVDGSEARETINIYCNDFSFPSVSLLAYFDRTMVTKPDDML